MPKSSVEERDVVRLVCKEGKVAGTVGEHGAEDAEWYGEKDVMDVVVLPKPVSTTLGAGVCVIFERLREAHRWFLSAEVITVGLSKCALAIEWDREVERCMN